MRRLIAAALSTLAVFAPVSSGARQDGPKLVLEDFFRGRTAGSGTFAIPLRGVRRDFTLTARGAWDGRTLTLVEDFVFADGERDRKTWRFRRTGPGRYVGTREDVIGTAEVTEEGNAVRLRYQLAVGEGAGPRTTLGFDDIMYLTADGTLVNEAALSYFGLPIGSTRVEFRRAR